MPAPERFAEDDDLGSLGVVTDERAARDRLDAKHVEEARRHRLRNHRFGRPVCADDGALPAEGGGHCFE